MGPNSPIRSKKRDIRQVAETGRAVVRVQADAIRALPRGQGGDGTDAAGAAVEGCVWVGRRKMFIVVAKPFGSIRVDNVVCNPHVVNQYWIGTRIVPGSFRNVGQSGSIRRSVVGVPVSGR